MTPLFHGLRGIFPVFERKPLLTEQCSDVFPFPWLVYGSFEYLKTVIVSWNQEQRHVEVFEGSRYGQERGLMLSYTSEPGDLITIESKPTSGNRLDILSSRDYWLVVKRKDGSDVASTEGQENSHFFATRIKDCLDLFP